MNFEEKETTYKEVTENSNASSKNLKSESKKSNYDAVEMSSKNLKVQSKKFDAIDVGLTPGLKCSL